MPESKDGGKWERWNGQNACVSDNGLFYETYIYRDKLGVAKEAVIAFRGTDDFLPDMSTSFSAILGIEPLEYKLAREKYIPNLISSLLNENKVIRIYAVGHSLGGGLAQQTGYQFNEVLKVFTFNTSPVTNYTYLRLNDNVNNNYPLIYRIFHGGEILESLRFITTKFTSTSFNRYDLSLQFTRRIPISGHSIDILACSLAEILLHNKNLSDDAAYQYGLNYVRTNVVHDPTKTDYQICNKKFLD